MSGGVHYVGMRHVVSRIVVVLAISGVSLCSAQQVPELAFEVASVRANTGPIGDQPGRPTPELSGGTLVIRNEPLLYLIEWAYDLPRTQIDGPAWLMEALFDIAAKTGSPANETQMRLMLRRLLAERVGLKTHTESRNMSVFALTVAKGGPKFQEATTDGQFSMDRTNSFVLSAHHARMLDLAQGISSEAGKVVVDETGLPGRYEIRLDLAPYVQRAADGSPGQQLDTASIMFTGLQEILGLKLEPRKANVDVLVIDHAEKTPTEN